MIRMLCVDISSADDKIYKILYKSASKERKCRADRYLRYEDKLRCVTADALLKMAAGTKSFEIEKNDFGKPYIKDRKDFYYNLSHSGHYVAIAWGNTEVGIDVQKHHKDTNMRMIAERYFTSDEQEYIWQRDHKIVERFYEIWTGKESYLKYTGKGLGVDMCSFSVLDLKDKIRFMKLEEEYSLSLCATDKEYTLEMPDIRQLCEGEIICPCFGRKDIRKQVI